MKKEMNKADYDWNCIMIKDHLELVKRLRKQNKDYLSKSTKQKDKN